MFPNQQGCGRISRPTGKPRQAPGGQSPRKSSTTQPVYHTRLPPNNLNQIKILTTCVFLQFYSFFEYFPTTFHSRSRHAWLRLEIMVVWQKDAKFQSFPSKARVNLCKLLFKFRYLLSGKSSQIYDKNAKRKNKES